MPNKLHATCFCCVRRHERRHAAAGLVAACWRPAHPCTSFRSSLQALSHAKSLQGKWAAAKGQTRQGQKRCFRDSGLFSNQLVS